MGRSQPGERSPLSTKSSLLCRLVSDLPMGLGIREAIRLVQQEASQARGEVEGEELVLEEATLEEGTEGEVGIGQDEEEVSSETGHK